MSTYEAVLIGLGIYGSIILITSVVFASKTKSASEFLIAGRRIPFLILTGSIVGTCIGTGVIIGASGLAYAHGWAGSAYPMGFGIGIVLAGLFFAVMRRFNFLTLGEEIACYYDRNRIVVEFSNIALFLSQVCWLTVQIMGGGALLGAFTGLSPHVSTLISGAVIAIICIAGGWNAVIYLAFLQGILLLLGFGSLVNLVLAHAGGLAGLSQSVPKAYLSPLGVKSYGLLPLIGMMLVLLLDIIADPHRRLTMYSARSEAGARWSMVVGGAVIIIFSASIGIAGMYAFRINPHIQQMDQALPWLIMKALPAWLAGLLGVVIVSAVLSSANGSAVAAGTFIVRHIFPLVAGRYPRHPLAAVRFGLVAVFAVSTAIALRAGDIVNFVLEFLPLTIGGLAVIVLTGRFWKRSTWQGALTALVITPVVALIFWIVHVRAGLLSEPIFPSVAAGVLTHVVVSLVTPPRRHSFEETASVMEAERTAVEGGDQAAGLEDPGSGLSGESNGGPPTVGTAQ